MSIHIFGVWGEDREPKQRRILSDAIQVEERVLYSLAVVFPKFSGNSSL